MLLAVKSNGPKFPAQFARASLKGWLGRLDDLELAAISRAICAGLIEGQCCFPNRNCSHPISRAICAGLIEGPSAWGWRRTMQQFPAQFARASLKGHVPVIGSPGLQQFPAQFARASLKDVVSRRTTLSNG